MLRTDHHVRFGVAEPTARAGPMAYAQLPNAVGESLGDAEMDHREHIRSELGGFFSQGHTEGVVTAGSFAYDEDTLRSLVTDWLDLADHYRESISHASSMIRVEGPGRDFASQAHAAAANSSGESYIAYLEQNRSYCTEQAQQFQNALDDYLGVEHRNIVEINKSGPQPGI